MPVAMWGDSSGTRLRQSYFDTYPGVWRHGDWVTVTSRGSCVVSGRSDATLNRGGVRMGTAEFYRVVEQLPEVVDSLVVHHDSGGADQLYLFVALRPGQELTAELRGKLTTAIRSQLSPRYTPDAILAVDGLPRTLTGKKLEVPVKRILAGQPLEQVASAEALTDPMALERLVAVLAELPG